MTNRLAPDIVVIDELKIDTIIGIHAWERRVRQTVVLSLEMATDITQAAATDDITFALNYQAVSERLLAFVGGSQFQLLETMAEQVAAIVRDEFQVSWLRLRVSKPGAIPAARAVGLVIERGYIERG